MENSDVSDQPDDQSADARFYKAAWAMEDLEQDIGFFYRTLDRKGLESLPGVGLGMAGVVEDLLLERLDPKTCRAL